jgi:hypothetical protein
VKCVWLLFFMMWSGVALGGDVTVQPFGFIQTSWIGSSGGVESFSQPNLSAYTAAGNPALNPRHDETVSSFQVAQSRLGFKVDAPDATQGILEFDFIDFAKSSPTTAAQPRLRRALIDHRPTTDWLFRIGQDWDIVSPLAPHSFNWVGHYFQAGDVAFMRIQAQAIHSSAEHEEAYAIGLPGSNNASGVQALEASLFPTLAYRQTWKREKNQHGFSALVSELRSPSSQNYFFAGVLNGFYQHFFEDQSEIRTEVYIGRNTVNLGLLGLSYGSGKNLDTGDAGAYVTYKKPVGQNLSWFSGVGYAAMMDPNNMASSTTHTASGSMLSGTGPGIEANFNVRSGVEKKLTSQLQLFGEIAYLETQHHLDPIDTASYRSFNRALVTQLGMQLNF